MILHSSKPVNLLKLTFLLQMFEQPDEANHAPGDTSGENVALIVTLIDLVLIRHPQLRGGGKGDPFNSNYSSKTTSRRFDIDNRKVGPPCTWPGVNIGLEACWQKVDCLISGFLSGYQDQ